MLTWTARCRDVVQIVVGLQVVDRHERRDEQEEHERCVHLQNRLSIDKKIK